MSVTFDRSLYGKLLAEYQPQVIESEEDYDHMLKNVEQLMGYKNRSPEQTALLQLLVRLIEEYENKNYPMGQSSPQAILQHLIEARGIEQSDLVNIIGSQESVSEIVNGKRAISNLEAMVLSKFFHVSVELFF